MSQRKTSEKYCHLFDQFIVDIKSINPDIYTEYTDGEVKRVLDNLELMIREGYADRITVRIPMIPGLTGKEEQAKDKRTLEMLGVRSFDLFQLCNSG